MAYLIEPSLFFYMLIGICFLSAVLHSSVGLGGGSSYIAWMVIFSVPAFMIPVLALSLNIIVSSIGVLQFARKRFMPWKNVFIILSVSLPAAYLGGSMSVSENTILCVLLVSLFCIFLRLLLINDQTKKIFLSKSMTLLFLIITGFGLGFLSGLVGIGGGIFLVPLLVIFNVANIQQAAACGSMFIFCNSIVGLWAKLKINNIDIQIEQLLPFFIAVILGGVLGSFFAIRQESINILQRLLKYTVLLACVLLFRRLVF